MTVLKLIVKTFLVFIVFTMIGQIHYNDDTLESRYHHYVNSESFQHSFQKLARPATWTYEKVSEALKQSMPSQAR